MCLLLYSFLNMLMDEFSPPPHPKKTDTPFPKSRCVVLTQTLHTSSICHSHSTVPVLQNLILSVIFIVLCTASPKSPNPHPHTPPCAIISISLSVSRLSISGIPNAPRSPSSIMKNPSHHSISSFPHVFQPKIRLSILLSL